jgi:YVTN family beta-propeller protein
MAGLPGSYRAEPGDMNCSIGVTVSARGLVLAPKLSGMRFLPTLPSFSRLRRLGPLLSVLAGAAVALTPVAFAQETPPVRGPSGYRLETTWKNLGDGGWDYLISDADTGRVYVTRTDRVQVIDGENGTLIGEVPGLDGGHGVALVPELHLGFATSGKSDTVLIFDLQTLKPVGEPVAVGEKPDAIIYDPASKHVFVFNGQGESASVIDPATAKVVATIPLGGGPEFAVADGKGTVFVNLEDESEILAIDAAKNVVTEHWPLAPGKSPSGLALDRTKRRLFAGCHNEQMSVLDADSGKHLASVPIGQGVDACAFYPGTSYAFASCGDGTLTVMQEDPAKAGEFRVVEQIKTRPGARTMALNSKSEALYLPAADFESAPAPAPAGKTARPKMIPGSFVILKFVR